MLFGWVHGDGANTIRILTVEGFELLGGHVVGLVFVSRYIDDNVITQEVYIITLV